MFKKRAQRTVFAISVIIGYVLGIGAFLSYVEPYWRLFWIIQLTLWCVVFLYFHKGSSETDELRLRHIYLYRELLKHGERAVGYGGYPAKVEDESFELPERILERYESVYSN